MLALVLSTVLAIPAAPPAPPVSAAAYSPDGKTMAVGTRERIHVLDAASGDNRLTLKGLTGRITTLAWVSPSRFVAASGEPGKSGVLTLFDLANPKPIASWTAHTDSIFALAASPDGKTLASAGYDRSIKLWTLGGETSKPQAILKDHSDAVYGLSFHPQGNLLASASADRAVKVWDVKTGKRLYTLGDCTDWVYAVSWSPDGKRIAAAGVDKSLRVWTADASGGQIDRSAFAHAGPVVQLAYTRDGQSIVTAGEDRVVKVWDAATLKERSTFKAQPDSILSLAVSPTNKRIAAGRYDGVLNELDLATGAVAMTPVPVKPIPPKPNAVTPGFLARGQTARITLTGTGLDKTTAIVSSHAKAKLIPSTDPTRLAAEITINPTAPPGPIQLVLQSEEGDSNPVAVTVERFAELAQKEERDSFASANLVPLNATLVGTLSRAGAVDYYRFRATAGQQVGIAATVKFASLLTLFDPAGKMLAVSSNGTLGMVCPVDGEYGLAIRDRDFRGGPDRVYRLSLGRVPVVTSVFPVAVSKGMTTTVHLSGVNLGEEGLGLTIPVTVAANESKSTLDLVPFMKRTEKPEGRTTIAVESIPAIVAHGTDSVLPQIPGAADGILTDRNASLNAAFHAKKGQTVIVEGLAQRYGSPVDPQIEILDAAGKVVPRALLRCVSKTYLTFRDHDSTKPGLRLETWNELATNDLLLIDNELVKIQQLPGNPDADCDFFAVNGRRLGFLDTTPTQHALNSPMYKVDVLPPGTSVVPNGMPVFPLDYRNDDGGPGYGKDSRIFFTPPADGEYRVRLTDALGSGGPNHTARIVVRPPQPDIKLNFTHTNPSVWKGGMIPVNVSIDRFDGFDGPVAVSIENLPPGFTSLPGRIDAGFQSTTLGISAAADAKTSKGPFKVVARFRVPGSDREIVREVPGQSVNAEEPGDLVTTTNLSTLAIQPGGEARFVVTVERKNGFKGRVPVDVQGLPHGVRVQNLGLNAIMITENETKREVVLRAESWIDAMSLPILVVAHREGKGGNYGAKPIVLNVEKPKK
ncbi:MAG: WD40 repeat domain-containing protein [Gemmataceae bacterium]